jgi:hypothetical protein
MKRRLARIAILAVGCSFGWLNPYASVAVVVGCAFGLAVVSPRVRLAIFGLLLAGWAVIALYLMDVYGWLGMTFYFGRNLGAFIFGWTVLLLCKGAAVVVQQRVLPGTLGQLLVFGGGALLPLALVSTMAWVGWEPVLDFVNRLSAERDRQYPDDDDLYFNYRARFVQPALVAGNVGTHC